MLAKMRNLVIATVTAALVLGPAVAVLSFVGADAAFAKNGDNGNSGGRGGGNGRENGNAGSRGKPDNAGSRGKPDTSGNLSRSNGNGLGLLNIFKKNKPVGAAATPRKPTTRVTKIKPAQRVGNTKPVYASVAPRPRPGPAVQSELKWMNAANASLNAYANAAPGSRVGQIATYRAALLEYEAASGDPDYQAELDEYLQVIGELAPEGTSAAEIEAILAEIQALDRDGTEPEQNALRDLLAETFPDATESELDELEAALGDAITSDNEIVALADERDRTFDVVRDGLEIAEGSAAWDHFHELLKLDEELPEKNSTAEEDVAEGDEEL